VQKIEAGRFTLALESFELGELLEHEVELFGAQSATHKLEFAAVEEPLAMVGDRNRVGQVIANLLSNAIKYSPAGGTVTITATPREGFARVQVTDTGLGIPGQSAGPGLHALLPRRLLDTREIGGTGLGLALLPRDRDRARRAHRLREHRGRRQHVLVRAAERVARQRRRQSRARAVIEDDPALTAAAQRVPGARRPRGRGWAGTGEAGLGRALARAPAVVCVDIHLPGALDGWQVLVQLKAEPAHRPCAV